MIESASNTSRHRRQVWLARMRQRDACWVGEVSLTGSRIGSQCSPCGSNREVSISEALRSSSVELFVKGD